MNRRDEAMARTEEAPSGNQRPRAEGGFPLSWRALLLALVLVPLLCIAVEYGELVALSGELVGSSLMLIVTCVLCLLLGANAVLGRSGCQRLTRAELLYLFIMLTAAGNVAGVGMVQMLVPLLGHLHHYANPANNWAYYERYVPAWIVPDTTVLAGYYGGQSTYFTADHFLGWLHPLVVWSAFIFVFIAFTLSLGLLLRRQWVERERLPFPITYFPLELTREGAPLWRDRLLWIGLAVPVVLQSLAGLNDIYPWVPYLPLKPTPALNIGRFFPPDHPLNAVTLAFYPMALGIAYFAQTEVLLSCWLFYWVARAEELASLALGFRGPMSQSDMPYLNQQSLGAYVALGAAALWLGRGEAVRAARSWLGRQEASASSRWALACLLITGALLVGFGLAISIPLPIILLFLAIYFLVVVGFSRLRATAGLPWLFGPNHPPHIFLTWAVGPRNLSVQTLTSLNFLQWFDWDYRGTPMAHQMEALKIAWAAGLKGRHVVRGILVSVALAAVVSFLAVLTICYRYGAGSGVVEQYRMNWAEMPLNLLTTWSESQRGVGWDEIGGGAAGAAVVALLGALHSRLPWWPLHPVGYALSCTFTLQWLWCPLFVVWAVKTLILRYGGIRLYRRGIPLAVGLILGDYAMTAFWALLGLLLGRQMYSTFWN